MIDLEIKERRMCTSIWMSGSEGLQQSWNCRRPGNTPGWNQQLQASFYWL